MQETWAVHGVYPGMSWTPDSRSIVYWAGGRHPSHRRRRSGAISDIPFHVAGTRFVEDARALREGRSRPTAFDVKMVRFAHASPDGRRVVYEALGHLWIKDAAGGAPRRLTRAGDNEFELYPAWSRDGRQIAYVSWNDQEAGRVKVVSASGGTGPHRHRRARPLSRAGLLARRPDDRLSQDQRRLSDHAVVGPRSRPLRRRARAAARRSASPRTARCRSSARSSDRLFFMANEAEDKRSLRSIELSRRERDDAPDLAKTPVEFAISPDEQYVAWTERYQAYVMPFVRSGRSIDISPGGKALPAGAGQHRRRRLAALVGQQPQPVLDAGARPVPPRPGDRRGLRAGRRRSRPRRRRFRSASRSEAARPSGHARADRRADHHDARR